jgi:hypothetical protein
MPRSPPARELDHEDSRGCGAERQRTELPAVRRGDRGARRIAGVTDVHNHLEVALPPENYRDDATLTTMANNALSLDVAVPDGVEATARNGNLTLTGTVSYGTEMAAAERAVAGLTGVHGLRDDIEISNDADPIDFVRGRSADTSPVEVRAGRGTTAARPATRPPPRRPGAVW